MLAQKTFQDISNIYDEILSILPKTRHAPVSLVACDLESSEKRQVSHQEGENLALDHRWKYFECHSKSGLSQQELL